MNAVPTEIIIVVCTCQNGSKNQELKSINHPNCTTLRIDYLPPIVYMTKLNATFNKQKSTFVFSHLRGPSWNCHFHHRASLYFACVVSASVQGRCAQAGSMPVIIYFWASLARRRNRPEAFAMGT